MAMMRPLFMIFAIGLTLAFAPAADAGLARALSADKDLVNLDGGRGVAKFSGYGVLWGGFARGKIRVTDLPGGGSSVRIRGRQSHRLGHRQAKGPRLVEPCTELLHRIVREVFFA